MTSLYLLQCGGCGGGAMSFLNSDSPDLIELFDTLGIQLLRHPSLSTLSPIAHDNPPERLIQWEQALNILVVEGAITRGPGQYRQRRPLSGVQ